MPTKTIRTVLAATAVTAALMMTGCSSGDAAPNVAGGDGTEKSKPQAGWMASHLAVLSDFAGNVRMPVLGSGSGMSA